MRNQIKQLARLCFYGLGSLKRPSKIPVLMYHSIDDTGSVISISTRVFKKHLQYLKDHGFETVSLDEYFNTPASQTANKVLITFDDGYQSLFSQALPILKEFSYKATVFLVTDYVGKNAEWIIRDQQIILDKLVAQLAFSKEEMEAEVRKLKELSKSKLLSWDEIREMEKHGFEFQSHSHTHPFVSVISVDEIKFELEQSKSILEENLNKKVSAFAYPYTDCNHPQVTELLAKIDYQGAFIGDQFPRGNHIGSNYQIIRLPLWEESTLFDLAFSLSPGYHWYKVCVQKIKSKLGKNQPSTGY